jgi:hypothetical protein
MSSSTLTVSGLRLIEAYRWRSHRPTARASPFNDEWWGQKVCVDFFFFSSDEVAGHLRAAGFEIEEIIEREPYPDVEHQSRGAYIFADDRTRERENAA